MTLEDLPSEIFHSLMVGIAILIGVITLPIWLPVFLVKLLWEALS
jgi:hypothetical protein